MGARAKNLTMEDKRAMMGLREAGYTNAEIARQMDVSVGTVIRWIGKQRFRDNKSAAPTVTRTMPKIIAVDFDGVLCENRWPEIGDPKEAVIQRLKAEQAAGAKVILWTCRTGTRLIDAALWCRWHGINLDAVNENLPEVVDAYGGDCRKISATEYWDDKAVPID